MKFWKKDDTLRSEAEVGFKIDTFLGVVLVLVSAGLAISSLGGLPALIAAFAFLLGRAVVFGIVMLPLERARILADSGSLSSVLDALGSSAEATRTDSDLAYERIITRRGRINREEEDEIDDFEDGI